MKLTSQIISYWDSTSHQHHMHTYTNGLNEIAEQRHGLNADREIAIPDHIFMKPQTVHEQAFMDNNSKNISYI